MDLVRAFDISQRLHSVAVDKAGNLYAITDTGLKHYSSDGVLVKSAPNVNGLDIAIDDSGSRLVLATDLWVTMIDTATIYDQNNKPLFRPASSFALPGNVAENFLAFAAFVQEPLGQVPGGGVDYGVLTPGNILVSNSPQSGVLRSCSSTRPLVNSFKSSICRSRLTTRCPRLGDRWVG